MKIKYLSAEDRSNLRILRSMNNDEEIRDFLSKVFQEPHTMQALWHYGKWLQRLTDELLIGHEELIVTQALVYILDGNIEKAVRLNKFLPKETFHGSIMRMLMPGYDKLSCLRVVKHAIDKGWCPLFNLPLTVGRPSLLNGVWDFTPYGSVLKTNRAKVEGYLGILFEGQASYIYEVALAEYLYWQGDSYNALVTLVGVIPFLKEKRDMGLLFVALTLQTYIMVLSGQASSTVPMMENLRKEIIGNQIEEYMPNVDALDAWAAMYDGDYQKVTRWMREGAPDEYSKFCMLDLFRYFVKIRGYLIQGKYLAITALASRVMPLLEAGTRYMDQCELHILWAMSDAAAGREEEAFEHIEKALALAERFRYDRLLADEGMRVRKLLMAYRNRIKGKNDYLDRVITLNEKTATLYPRYLKSQLPQMPALTETELRVLWLLADFRTNKEIAQITGTSVDNIKKHCKNINAKLEVKNRHQAVQRAVEYGILKGNTIK